MPSSPDSPTFAEAWELWLAYRTHGTRPLRASTRADGWRQLQTALRYLHTPDSLLAAADRLSAIRDTLGNGPPLQRN